MRAVLFLLMLACALALEVELRAMRDGKPTYKSYLAKVKGFFNQTVSY